MKLEVGSEIGNLTIVELAERDKRSRRHWLCRCSCGTVKKIREDHLKRGHVVSCGCYARKVNSEKQTKHGGSGTLEFNSWVSMKVRCLNPDDQAYPLYGGRGITVCDRWKSSFQNFIDDMGLRPGPEYSIERRNNDLGYTPENCYWATKKEQANNRRNNIVYYWQGKRMTVTQIAEFFALKQWIYMGI